MKTPCRNGNKHFSNTAATSRDMLLRSVGVFSTYHARHLREVELLWACKVLRRKIPIMARR